MGTPTAATQDPLATATPVGHGGAIVDITEQRAWSQGAAAAGVAIAAGIVFIIIAGNLIAGATAQTETGTTAIPRLVVGIVLVFATAAIFSMVRIINPGETKVVQFFGRYIGTVRRTGLCLVPPLCTTTKVSVKVRNFETNAIKVNDLNGNPINIGAIIVWQVADTAKAIFAVEDMDEFIHSQSESALRHVATTHPYDSADVTTVPSLSGSTDVVSAELAEEVAARAAIAGLEIIETRISALSYAPEIAQAMLQRQQASAIVDARETIVEGAVGMVKSALDQLEQRDIVDLDPERRASMVSNLLVVLCSDTATQPVVNTGSLYT
ncbi:MAG: SPFH domain-containing protein [Corynebacterium sp.]|uniref:SPFH domain-containing protein n=1 Tax=Corynebacterium sp. TaxID=1720 RepID=UPI0026DB670C|nr:SPFH domain-containing protein [Corynebacterium sp.]MDO5099287.1 SPFH domain-containing protein [Corynebacterium sp.]